MPLLHVVTKRHEHQLTAPLRRPSRTGVISVSVSFTPVQEDSETAQRAETVHCSGMAGGLGAVLCLPVDRGAGLGKEVQCGL